MVPEFPEADGAAELGMQYAVCTCTCMQYVCAATLFFFEFLVGVGREAGYLGADVGCRCGTCVCVYVCVCGVAEVGLGGYDMCVVGVIPGRG